MFTIYFWRRLHCRTKMRDWGNPITPYNWDEGYCLDRYCLEFDK